MESITKITDDKDVVQITKIINASFLTVAEEFGFTIEIAPTFPAFISPEIIFDQIKNGLDLFAMRIDESIIGSIGIRNTNENNIYKIERLAVLPIFRRKNIGKKLMEFASKMIIERNGKIAQVEIVNENVRLKNWYVCQDYKEIRIENYDHLPFTVSVLNKVLTEK